MKGWVSVGEAYPVYFLTPETAEDYEFMAHSVSGHEIELTDEEYADFMRVLAEDAAWQKRLSGWVDATEDNGSGAITDDAGLTDDHTAELTK